MKTTENILVHRGLLLDNAELPLLEEPVAECCQEKFPLTW